jgi:hypothetical protein
MRAEKTTKGTLPAENRKIEASLALLAPSRVNQMVGMLKTTLSRNNHIDNLGRLNSFANQLKRSLPTYPGGPQVSRNQVKSAAIMAMASYISQKIGFKNNANTRRLYDLLIKLMKIRVLIEDPRVNKNTRTKAGYEIGRVLGELVIVWTFMENKRLPGAPTQEIGKGALRGFLNKTIGGPLSGTVMGTIEGISGFQNLTRGFKF